jgi:hypothetical protein
VIPAYEDVARIIDEEQRWPENFDPLKADLKQPDERLRVAKPAGARPRRAAGYVLPLKALPPVAASKKRRYRPRSADAERAGPRCA